LEVIYERAPIPADVDAAPRASCALGLDNLWTLASDKPGFAPRIVNGRPVKSIDQFHDKRRAAFQHVLGEAHTSWRLERLTTRRTRRIDHYLHTASRRIMDLLVDENSGTLVIGKNSLWKQEANMGRRTNQQGVAIPHARFIEMLTYKAQLVGIQVIVTEESHTSKASFLDRDPLPIYGVEAANIPPFSGKRVKRGLYRAASGRRIQADVNGAYNIVRKAVPNSFGQGIEAVVVRPVRLAA
jgi:putative transposase